MKKMKKIILMIMISISSLSCYDGLNDMLGDLDMKVPICVDGSVTASGNGRGWANAYKTIQEAINNADAGDEIWVAGNWDITTEITISESIALYGGFNGTESRIEQRPGKSNITGSAGGNAFVIQNQSITINGFNFNKTNGGNSINIYSTGSEYSAIIENCNFTNCAGVPVFLNTNTGTRLVSINITGCNFHDNSPVGSKVSNGGAVNIANGNATISNTVFNGYNSTVNGGAITVRNSILTIADCDFTLNTTSGDGGAIYAASGNTITIRDKCTFTGNHASGIGGAITCADNNTITTTDSDFISNYAAYGGAIYSSKQTSDTTPLNITGCTFNDNYTTAGYGGAIYLELLQGNTETVNITGCDFIKNRAATYGGAMYSTGSGKITLTDCDFGIEGSAADANTATHGGALHIVNTVAIISSTDFYNNTATTGGGAIYITGGSSNVTINGTSAKKCEIYGNTVSSGDGGGIYQTNGTTRIVNSEINTNTASANGGGVYLNSDGNIIFTLINSKIINNDADSATALHEESSSTLFVYIYNSLFADSQSETASLIVINNSTLTNIYNSSFISHNNLGTFNGGGPSINAYNCILFGSIANPDNMKNGRYFNTATNLNLDDYISGYHYNTVAISSSAFANFSAGDYSPSQNSTLINNGIMLIENPPGTWTSLVDILVANSIPLIDLADNPRIVNSIVDIGCYERQ